MDKEKLKIEIKLLFNKYFHTDIVSDNIKYEINENGCLEHNYDAHVFILLNKFDSTPPMVRGDKINRFCCDYETFSFILENNNKIEIKNLSEDECLEINNYLLSL